MNEPYYVGIYWQQGVSSASECAVKLALFLQQLAQQDAIFERWYQTSRSRSKALNLPIQANEQVLETLLAKKQPTNSDFGYNLKIWTGNSDLVSATVSFRCGCNNRKLPGLLNLCLVELPIDDTELASILRLDTLTNIMKIGVEIWNADYAVVTSNDYLKSFLDRGVSTTKIGLLTYVQTSNDDLPSLGTDFQVERFLKGVLVTTRSVLSAENPNDIQTILVADDQLAKYLSNSSL